MRHLKKLVTIIVTIAILSSMCVIGSTFSASASGTGAGLAEWAMNAYYEGWAYVYGGSSPGAVDCSGLIYAYTGGPRTADVQVNSASESGSVSDGVPRIHGLGLYHPGHVGVYVGNGMAVDARNESAGVCYSSVDYMRWTTWFKLSNVSYPSYGWVNFNGNYYYYEDGQYIVNTSRTIDGVTYYFGSDGISDTTPSDPSSVADEPSNSGNSGSSVSSGSSSTPSYKTLQLGSQGDEVAKLQNRLAELGFYKGEISGIFDEATQSAYINFQKAAGVTVDGISGASDQELLYSDNAPIAPEESEQDKALLEKITSAQTRLRELNYYLGESDGTIGSMTKEGLIAFQQVNNLEVTGELDDATYEALMSDGALANPYYTSSSATGTPTSVYTFNAYELNSTGIMGPNPAVSNANNSSFILSNSNAENNAKLANDVVTKTNRLARNAVSSFASEGFKAVGPQGGLKLNGAVIGLLGVVLTISLISVYMLARMRKEKKRKAARAAARAQKRILRLNENF